MGKYFDLNDLEVNLAKTKVIKYRRSGQLCKQDKLYYKGEQVEFVKNYMYLGIEQCSSGLFVSTCKDRIAKARASMGAALSTCKSANLYSFNARLKLFDAIVTNSLLYAAPIWAIQPKFMIDVEVIQSLFLKRTLCLPGNTSSHMLRCETGCVKLKCRIFENLLKFWYRVLCMEDNRLVKICYKRLVELHNPGLRDVRYNWASQVRLLVQEVGYEYVWDSHDPAVLADKFCEMTAAFRLKCRNEDADRLLTNTDHPCYHLTYTFGSAAGYLHCHMPFYIKSCLVQIRLNCAKLYYRGISVDLSSDTCTLCLVSTVMNFEHLLLHCQALQQQRQNCPVLRSCETYKNLLTSLNAINDDVAKSLFYFFVKLARLLQSSPSIV